MKRIAAVLVLAACAHGAPPVPSVRLASDVPRPSAGGSGTLLGECRIVGAGERAPEHGEEGQPFAVFANQAASAPALVIEVPSAVHLAWSRFPARPSEGARAHVELGEQAHVRYAGWSELRGRTFSAKRRIYATRGHLWARAGAPIEMTAVEDGQAIATVATPFASPKTLSVRGACDAVAYEPHATEAADEARGGGETVVNRDVSIDLYAAAGGRAFVAITFDAATTESLRVLERRDGFLRVTAEDGDVGFDAWVPEGQTREYIGHGSGTGYGYGSSHCGLRGWSEHGAVAKDTPLFVGKLPEGLAGAVVEKNAAIVYRSRDAKTVGRVVVVPFEFVDRFVAAPDGQQLWIAKGAIAPE